MVEDIYEVVNIQIKHLKYLSLKYNYTFKYIFAFMFFLKYQYVLFFEQK